MNVDKFSTKQRVSTVRAYLKEVERICRDHFKGNWEEMPTQLAGLPVRWDVIVAKSGIKTTAAGASRLVYRSLAMDSVMDSV